MKLTVLVPCFNQMIYTQICMKSLVETLDHLDYEVLVVNNNSTDGTREYLDALAKENDRIKPIHNATNAGFTIAVNIGFTQGTGDVFCILNNDMIFAKGWIEPLLNLIKDPSVGIASAPLIENLFPRKEPSFEHIEKFRNWFKGQINHQIVDGANCPWVMTRKVVNKVGLLDEQFIHGWYADWDYYNRVLRAGLSMKLIFPCYVYHYSFVTMETISHMKSEWDRNNQIRYITKWKGIEGPMWGRGGLGGASFL